MMKEVTVLLIGVVILIAVVLAVKKKANTKVLENVSSKGRAW
jgi:hypothetical protein